jgi:hypothetical protein
MYMLVINNNVPASYLFCIGVVFTWDVVGSPWAVFIFNRGK